MSALAHNPLFDSCTCETCRLLDALEPILSRYRATRERSEANHLLKATRLARSLDVAEALLMGEAVPLSQLDPAWRKAYGI